MNNFFWGGGSQLFADFNFLLGVLEPNPTPTPPPQKKRGMTVSNISNI